MAQEDFLKQLWRAIRHAVPSVATDGSNTVDASAIEQRLAAADLWLTPKTVEGYDPADFSDWPLESREVLTRAVEEFRTIAEGVPEAGPAEPTQRAAAAKWLARIIDTIQPIVRGTWVAAADALIAETESWCRARDWAARRLPNKVLAEPLIGRYEAPQLLIHLPEARVVLTPVSRFVAGGTGLFDLYAMPTLGGRSIIRRTGGWELSPASAKGRPKPWTEAAFAEAVLSLVREAA